MLSRYINIRSFLHLFLHLHLFSFVYLFIFVAIKRYRSDDESYEGSNTKDPDIDFKRVENQAEDEEDKDAGFPLELERMVTQENREMKPHEEETEIVNLGVGEEKKEVKVGTPI